MKLVLNMGIAKNNAKMLYDRIMTSPKIVHYNKGYIENFDTLLKANDFTDYTRVHYLFILEMLSTKIPKNFKDMNKDDIQKFVISLKERYAPSSQDVYKSCIKKFFQWFYKMDDREYPDIVKWIKTRTGKNSRGKLPEELLSESEIRRMVGCCDNFRDSAMIMVLYEGALRCGELLSMKIKHVEIDDNIPVMRITVDGKTGMRKLPLVDSVPYLRNWLNTHPSRNDKESRLWTSLRLSKKTRTAWALTHEGIRGTVKLVGERAGIGKRIYPHLFRHSRLTELAKIMTDSELRMFAGWSKDSSMTATYIHLSQRDIETKLLESKGLIQRKDKRKKELEPKTCLRCSEINPVTAKFCQRCSQILDLQTAIEIDKQRKDSDDVMNKLFQDNFFVKDFKKHLERLGIAKQKGGK